LAQALVVVDHQDICRHLSGPGLRASRAARLIAEVLYRLLRLGMLLRELGLVQEVTLAGGIGACNAARVERNL
jgi:hypothetical protein